MLGRTPRAKRLNSVEGSPVEVFCRLKPSNPNQQAEECVSADGHKKVILYRPGDTRSFQFLFTKVFSDATQSDVFSNVALPLVNDLISGKNGLLFCYGVTGSGKTYTMEGTLETPGILSRSLDVLFNSVDDFLTKKYIIRSDRLNGFNIFSEANAMLERQRVELMNRQNRIKTTVSFDGYREREMGRINNIDESVSYSVFVSYVEIYNNYIYDLLEDYPSTGNSIPKTPMSKTLREDSKKCMFVSGVTEVECRSADEAYNAYWNGQKRRRVAHTVLNAESSRSHSVFMVRLVRAPYDNMSDEIVQDKDRIHVSQLCLVDLAGSERTVRTGNTGHRLREASQINNSLLVLRRCIEALRDNQRTASSNQAKIVPYRESKITHLFRNYFDGDGSVKMVVCVNKNLDEFDETSNVLKFAEMTQEVQVVRTLEPDIWPCTPSAPPKPLQEKPNNLLWEFNNIPVLPDFEFDTEKDDFSVHVSNRFIQQLETLLHARNQSYQDVLQHMSLFRAQLEVTGDNSDSDSERSLRSEKSQLEKRIRNLEVKMSRERSSAKAEREELEHKIAENERLINRERADNDRLKDQINYQLGDTVCRGTPESASATPKVRIVRAGTPLSTFASASRIRMKDGVVSRMRNKFSPPSTSRPPPPANARFHRRSKSAGQIWIEHHPKNETPMGTVLQACGSGGKRRSVTKLESADVEKATNYMLTHQRSDDRGQLTTMIYTGDVVPTAGGGSSVIFRDVEKLEQVSPTSALLSPRASRKRSSTAARDIQLAELESLSDLDDEDCSPVSAKRQC